MKAIRPIEISEEVLSAYRSRFVNDFNTFFYQWSDDAGDCRYSRCDEPVSNGLVRQHLQGRTTIALPALNGRGDEATSKWLCFDSDREDGKLESVRRLFETFGWPTILDSRRLELPEKRIRPGHLWILFDKPIPTSNAIKIGKHFIRHAGVEESAHFELFPKSQTGFSQIRAPLGFHAKKNARCWTWFSECANQDIRYQLEWLAMQPSVCSKSAMRYAAVLSNNDFKTPLQTVSARMGPWAPKATAAELAGRLSNCATVRKGGFRTHCPNHEDKSPSFEFWDSAEGLAFKCYANCPRHQILHALRLRGCI